MKKKFLYYAILLLVLAGTGFYFFNQPASAPVSPQPIVVILGPQNDSGVSGNALITAEEGGVKVILDLMGAPKNAKQPAHIHSGTCAYIGEVQYPLVFPENGKSETMLDIQMAELRTAQSLAINVHKLLEEPGVYVACGEITF